MNVDTSGKPEGETAGVKRYIVNGEGVLAPMTDEAKAFYERPTATGYKPLMIPTTEQMHLIAQILDAMCAQFVEPCITTLGAMGLRCKFCKASGVLVGLDQIKYEHTDECVLALNKQLQETLKEPEK